MKKIFYLFLLISATVHGQEDTSRYSKYPSAYGPQYTHGWFTKSLRVPFTDTAAINALPGALQSGLDGSPYWWDGVKWGKLGSANELSAYVKYADSVVKYVTPFQLLSYNYISSISDIPAGGDLSGTYPNPTVSLLNGYLPSYYLDRANHTGTQSYSTIAGLSAVGHTGAYSDLSGTPASLPTTSTLQDVMINGNSQSQDNTINLNNHNLSIVGGSAGNDVVNIHAGSNLSLVDISASRTNISSTEMHFNGAAAVFGALGTYMEGGLIVDDVADGLSLRDISFNAYLHHIQVIAGTIGKIRLMSTNAIDTLPNLDYLRGLYFPLSGGTLSHTDGTGYIGLPLQSTAAPTPADGINLYSVGGLSWKGPSGFQRRFLASAITADRDFTLPDVSGTVGISAYANTWTANNTFTGNVIGGSNNNFLWNSSTNQLQISSTGATPTGTIRTLELVESGGTSAVYSAQATNNAGTPGYEIKDDAGVRQLGIYYGNSANSTTQYRGQVVLNSTQGAPIAFYINGATSERFRIANAGVKQFNAGASDVTNFEDVNMGWASNQFRIISEAGGTGITRGIIIGNSTGSYIGINSVATALIEVRRNTTSISNLMTITSSGLAGTSNVQNALNISPTVNQTSTAGFRALYISPQMTAPGSGVQELINAGTNSSTDGTGTHTSLFKVLTDGHVFQSATITATGTTGNQTINKPSGTVNIAASGTTVTVTNSLVTTSSIIIPVIRTNDATAAIKNVVPGSGSFVINLTAAATAEVSVGFWVLN